MEGFNGRDRVRALAVVVLRIAIVAALVVTAASAVAYS